MSFLFNVAVGAFIIKNVVVFSLCAIGVCYVLNKVVYVVNNF